jgi:diguanylate cyclase (GGDEF)-like protein
LVRVTGTIIGLARGDLEEPVALPERAFGFDRLGAALEQLRQEMVERHLLAERNEAQQAIIETNLQKLESANREMAWMAMHDPLTGLANRRQADLDLDALTGGDARSQAGFCVMQVDIDRFKTINDSLGHAAGDFVLKAVSKILKSCVGPDANCYRIGGDEFLIVLFGIDNVEQAASLAERLIKRIEAPMDFSGHRCNVGASIGIALAQESGFDAMQGVLNADLALYHVKRTGRGTFKFFNDELAALSSRTKHLSDKLIAALEQKSFLPYYQPQFDAKTRRLRGVEVLCRWHNEELGWISPGEFLPVAEELEAVGKIDEILFEKVAKDLHTLVDLGISLPRVSFNLAADRLLKSGLAAELSGKIGMHTKIAVELLESMSLDNPPESVRWAIDELREHGIDIEIDDFGSHRASLAGLMAINPQTMKIDRSIVIPIVESQRHLDLVKKIIDIGAALNIEVLAEGVETEEHAEQLGALGCGVLQGFGLARPMPFEDLVAFCNHTVEKSNAVA